MDLGPTPCIGTQVHAGERILHGNFADKINQTARRRNTRLQTGNALEHLHTLLVFPSRRNEVAAGQTIAQEIVVLVQEKTTYRQAFNIARGVVAVCQRGIQLDGVGQRRCCRGRQQICAQHADALRRAGQRHIEPAHIGTLHLQHRGQAPRHGHFLQSGVGILSPHWRDQSAGNGPRQRLWGDEDSLVCTKCHRVSLFRRQGEYEYPLADPVAPVNS